MSYENHLFYPTGIVDSLWILENMQIVYLPTQINRGVDEMQILQK
jgi:hypothetical protein